MPKVVDHAARRAELVGAVSRVIRRDGIRAVSVRNVAAESGHSAGALRHYFDSQAGLIAFTMQEMGERAASRIRERLQAPDPDPSEVLCELLPLDPDRAAEFEVWLELQTWSRTEPVLAPLAHRAHQAVAEVCAWAIDQVRPQDPPVVRRRRARELHALLDGLALHLSLGAADLDSGQARAAVERWMSRKH